MFVSKDVKFDELLENSTSKEDVDDPYVSSISPNWLDIDKHKARLVAKGFAQK